MQLQKNALDVLTIANDGATTFKNASNSTSAFQIQDSTSGSLFNVDSINSVLSLNGQNSPKLQTWNSASSLLTARRIPGAKYGGNGYIYVVGGYNGGQLTTTEYAKVKNDGTLSTWASGTSLNTARQAAGVVVANGYIYAVGGTDGTDLDTVEYARINSDGSLGSWVTDANVLNTPRQRASAVVANGYIYIVGGTNGGNLNSVEYAKIKGDGSLDTWNTTATLNTARNSHALAVSNGFIYVVGGTNGSVLSSTEYAPINLSGTIGTWTTGTTLNTARQSTTSVIANGYIYAIGGSSPTLLGGVEYAPLNSSGAMGSWTADTNSLSTARDDMVSVVVNGYVYAIGGYSGAISGVVEYASTARIKMGGALDLVGFSAGDLFSGDGGGAGGELTAGNTNIIGGLRVQGQSNFSQALAANDLTVKGLSAFRNATDSALAFQIQNSAGNSNLFVASTTDSRVGIGAVPANSLLTIGTNTTIASGGLTFGTDTNLYRSGANSLQTDDSFWVGGTFNVDPATGNILSSGDLTLNGGNISTSSTTFNLANATATTLNIGAVAASGGINFAGGYGSTGCSINGSNGDLSCSGGLTLDSGVSATTGIFSGALAANGGITFDNSTDTLGAFTLAGTVDGANQLITNIGNAGTDFTSGGGLTLAGDFNSNAVSTFSSTTGSTGAFQVQNSSGLDILNVNTSTTPTLVSNSSLENGINGWSKKGNASVAITSSDEVATTFGNRELKIVTTANANDGATFNFTPLPSMPYSITFWARSTASTGANISFGHRENSGTGDVDCLTGQTLTTTWTQFTCTNYITNATINDP
ncbi:MAG: hypothetical protein AAB914_01785, partial [Patescibacteria group bacterium]